MTGIDNGRYFKTTLTMRCMSQLKYEILLKQYVYLIQLFKNEVTKLYLLELLFSDSSKTYLPEDKANSVVNTQDFEIRLESPSSDDFDF